MAVLKTPITAGDHLLGALDAPVVLVEYGDYECPFCAAAQPIVKSLLQSFGGDLSLVFRHFPLTQAHPHAGIAAQAAEYAADAGRFWEMHEALFANQARLSLSVILALVEALGLSGTGLQAALESGRYAAKVRADFLSGARSGVNGTPCFFVNGVRHDGSWSFDDLAAAIEAARRRPSGAQPAAQDHHP